MKNDTSTTNYLAAAKSSQYDALQRQVSSLTQHWMDHTSRLKQSRLIPILCDYIENTPFLHFQCNQTEIFSTKSNFFLGKLIQFFLEIQDGEIHHEEMAEKRTEIEKILNEFAVLSHQKSTDLEINLKGINQEQQELINSNQESIESSMHIKWWLKFISFFSKQR